MNKKLFFTFILLSQLIIAQNTQTLTSSGSYVVPCGITSITVQCWGGGGGGGEARKNPSGGGGGAGGAYSYSVIGVSVGQSITYTVGNGGNGGNGDGSTGGSSSFGGVIAVGGAGGDQSNSSNFSGNGATGSSAGSVGFTIYKGGNGGTGLLGNSGGGGGAGAGTTGNGANGVLATGATGANGGGSGGNAGSNSTGSDGTIPGGGGGGGRTSNGTDRNGGDGARGQIVISFTGTPIVSNAGADQTITSCSAGTVTLAGNIIAGSTGLWTCLSGCTGVSITTPTLATTKVTGLVPNTAIVLRWTLSSATGSCSSVDNMQIIVNCTATNDNPCTATAASVNSVAVCNNVTPGSVYGATASSLANNCGGTANDDVWFNFVANSTSQDISLINIAGSTTDLYHSVYKGTCTTLNTTALVCSDPNNSTVTGLTVGTTYYVRVYTRNNNSGQNTVFNLCIKPTPPPPTNTSCAVMNPICSDSPVSFQAQATGGTAPAGPNYGCLSTRPNPTWFYLKVGAAGNLSIDITANSDVDYAVWGPYPSLSAAQASCTSYPTPKNCSYSGSNVEQANIASAQVGEVYVLLVTNYAGIVQTINLTSADASAGSTDCAIVPTPIELLNFDANITDDKKVKLNWSTATETNNDYFEIQHSENAYSWESLGTLKGAGNTTIKQNYQFTDNNPQQGLNYYRLKQVDFDKTTSYSNSISVDFNSLPENINNLHPNPTKDGVSFDWSSARAGNIIIELVNYKGESVYKQTKRVEEGNNHYTVDLAEFSNGIYLLKSTNETSGKTSLYKLMKL